MTYQYFQKYPLATFTLDNYESMQVMPDLTTRSKFLANVVTNASNYDEYDIVSGETPEITADKFYGDSGLHWIILQSNGILDPRFGWPLDQFDLKKFTEAKYGSIIATHHYEDSTGNITTFANLIVTPTVSSSISSDTVSKGDVILNNTNPGIAVVTSINENGVIEINVDNPGANFTSTPNVTIVPNFGGSLGSNATAIVNLDTTNNTIANVIITNPGSGYTDGATANIVGGGGDSAILSAVISEDVLTIRPTSGGFVTGDELVKANGSPFVSSVPCIINSSEIRNGFAITNLIHEDRENDAKRSIKIIKSDFVPSIISQFENLMKI